MFQVALQFPHQLGVKFAVEILRNFIDDLSASHCGHPFPKYLVNSSRNFRRERRSRVFTTGMLTPSIVAVSSIENFSTSRRVKMVRDLGSSVWITSARICCSSLVRQAFSGSSPQLSTSSGIKLPSSPSRGSSSEDSFHKVRFLSFPSATFTAMRTSQV